MQGFSHYLEQDGYRLLSADLNGHTTTNLGVGSSNLSGRASNFNELNGNLGLLQVRDFPPGIRWGNKGRLAILGEIEEFLTGFGSSRRRTTTPRSCGTRPSERS